MQKEQRRFIANLTLPHNFQRSHAFLGRGDTPERIAPMPQGDEGFFKDGSRPNGVHFFAGSASPKESGIAMAHRGVGHLIDVFIPAFGTAGFVAPSSAFNE